MWHPDGPQGDETRKIRHLVAHYTRGRGLDVGCGPYKLWPRSIGIDAAGSDITGDGTKLSMFGDAELDYVFSSHFLEHVADAPAALAEWWRVIKPGGHLALYLPHQDLYPRVGQPGANPDHKHDLSPERVLAWLHAVVAASGTGAHVCEAEVRDGGSGTDEFSEYSFLMVLRKQGDPGEWSMAEPVQVPREKRLLLVRYGGLGDGLIAASCLPGLKKQGWHITVNTVPAIEKVLRHNPYIDDWIIQEPGQVPDELLDLYLDRLNERFGRVVLASWEEGLLPDRGAIRWTWPQDTRHRLMNVNYMERMHDIAGVPQADYDCRFYGDASEVEFDAYDGPTIAWVMRGSGKIKLWPHISQAVIRLLYRTNARIVLLGEGDRETKAMQSLVLDMVRHWFGRTGHRVLGCCGHTDIRGSFAAALGADVVVGPETGIMNGMAMHPMPKVVLLSHSTPENLTKLWLNTQALIPQTPDYPDHRLHNAEFYRLGYRSPLDLRVDPATGAPELIANHDVETVVSAIIRALELAKGAGDGLHDAGRGQDHGGVDQILAEPLDGALDDGADRGGSLDLPEAPGAGDALLDGRHARNGRRYPGLADGLPRDDADGVHQSEGREPLHDAGAA